MASKKKDKKYSDPMMEAGRRLGKRTEDFGVEIGRLPSKMRKRLKQEGYI